MKKSPRSINAFSFSLVLWVFFLAFTTVDTRAQLKVLPLGNSITKGVWCTNGAIGSCQPLADASAIGYRHHLYNLLADAGYNPDFVGSQYSGQSVMSDPYHGGFAGIHSWELAAVMETGTSSHTGVVSPGPYLNTASNQADIILLHIGTNDIQQGQTGVNHVKAILDAVDTYEQSSGNPVVVFVSKVISEKGYSCNTRPGVVAFNNNLTTLVQNRIAMGDHLELVDMECAAGIDYINDMTDELHPNQNGYDKMADLWFEEIDNYNSTPTLSQIANQDVDRGEAFSTISLDAYVSDPETPAANIDWSVSPASPEHFSVSIDPVSHVATVVPRNEQWSGMETIEFVATDDGRVLETLRKSSSCLVDFTVNWIPEIIGQQNISIAEGATHTITPADLILVENEKVPAGMVLIVGNGSNYTVQGQTIIPDLNFNGELQVPVKAIANGRESNVYNLVISVDVVNYPPIILSSPPLSVKTGHSYSYQLVVSDQDPEDVMQYGANQKPGWMMIHPSTGLVSGTPARNQAGVESIVLTVSDGIATTTQAFQLNVVYYNYPPEIESVPKDSAEVGNTYSYGITASDNENDPLVYFDYNIPDWLDFNPASQVLIGTPAKADLGQTLVTLGVSDGIDTSFQSFNLHVFESTSAGNRFEAEALRVYPNPVRDLIRVELPEGPGRSVSFELIDMNGRVILQRELSGASSSIDLRAGSFRNGMYFYRLSEKGYTKILKTGRLILQLSGN